ncbi:hypothetical protein LCGC14_1259920 [marine sediment metagenome]|uniref:DNA-directed DNA polymerase family A palm domain-containing protein n=1 Tax=marine sediment metagenome TaxID=412755 RepID=A0A0F9P4F0_9ZZZZ
MTDAPVVYVDLIGLTRQDLTTAAALIKALGIEGQSLKTHDERLVVLSELRGSAGITVYTGPFGAAFWMLASPEIKIRVEADGTDYTERTTSIEEWAFRAAGATEVHTRAMLKREKPPTKRAKDYGLWVRAAALKSEMLGLIDKNPRIRIHSPAPVEVLYAHGDQYRLLADIQNGSERTAEDWEWEKDTPGHPPVGLAVSTSTGNWYLPVQGSDYPYDKKHAEALRRVWAERLQYGPPVVLHNGRADLSKQYPGDPLHLSGRPIDDTSVMAYNAGDNDLHLKVLTRERLGRDPTDYPGELRDMPVELASRYAAAGDTRNTYDLYENLSAALAKREQVSVYEVMERPLVPVIASMEKGGTPIDPVRLDELRHDFGAMAEAMRSMMWARFHKDISKKDDIRALVLELTGYDPGSVSKDVLAKIPDRWMDSILAYRRLSHRKTAFLDKEYERWVEAGKPEDFRGYGYFNQAGNPNPDDPRSFKLAPRTGRLSSSGDFGNFMNQPLDIRDIFTAPEGCDFWSLDYKGIETHTAAAMSQDSEMMKVLLSGGDMHDDLVAHVLRLTGTEVGRPVAKRANFGAQNGGGADVVVKALALERNPVTYSVAKVIMDAHHSRYSGYHAWCASVIEEGKRNGGWAWTLWGRARYEPDVLSPDRRLAGHAGRALHTHIIQGTAADVLKLAMAWLVPTILKYGAHLALQVHDELCGWVPKGATKDFIIAMTAVMESIELPGLRLTVTGGLGKDWSEVH